MTGPLTEEQFEALGKWMISTAMAVSYRHMAVATDVKEAAEEVARDLSQAARRALTGGSDV